VSTLYSHKEREEKGIKVSGLQSTQLWYRITVLVVQCQKLVITELGLENRRTIAVAH
jgi:hypothetical protein